MIALSPLQSVDDITTLHDSFQRLTEGVEGYSIVLLDAKGTILTWNKGVEKLKGYRAEEIIGQHISMFYMPLDRQRGLPQKLLNEASARGVAKHVGRRVRKDGSIFWGSIEIAAIKDSSGKVIGFTKLVRELSEQSEIGFFWFDTNGILHTKASDVPLTKKRIEEFRSTLASATLEDKVCCVADMRDAILTEKGTAFSVATIPKLYKAIAFITGKHSDDATREMINLLGEKLPVKIFQSRNEATEWVKQYL